DQSPRQAAGHGRCSGSLAARRRTARTAIGRRRSQPGGSSGCAGAARSADRQAQGTAAIRPSA
nr:hypothetical protein [Tanacetum cinerariifolium]